MAKLLCKSIRTDHTHTTTPIPEYPWSWAPTRDIKIKKVSFTLDLPAVVGGGTMWWWLSIGAATILGVVTHINEEETIFALGHLRQEVTVGLQGETKEWMFDFGTDYVEVEEGEKIYLGLMGATGQMCGVALGLFYT